MNFPISAAISQASPSFPTAKVLKIEGNSGGIPNSFQWSQLDAADALLTQSVSPMTADQWAGWVDQDDRVYILDSVAANLSLTLDHTVNLEPAAARISSSPRKATGRRRTP